jgi:hypothetical protein
MLSDAAIGRHPRKEPLRDSNHTNSPLCATFGAGFKWVVQKSAWKMGKKSEREKLGEEKKERERERSSPNRNVAIRIPGTLCSDALAQSCHIFLLSFTFQLNFRKFFNNIIPNSHQLSRRPTLAAAIRSKFST